MNKPKISLPALNFEKIAQDFRNLNPNDIGAWPAVPRFAVLIGLFVGLLVAGYVVVWSEQYGVLDGRREEELKLKDEYVSKKRQTINLSLYEQQLNEIDRSFGALLKQLPNKAEVESLLVEINQSGLGRGLSFELFKPGQEALKEFYAELPVSVKLTGNYHDLGAFAEDIGRLPRIVTLNNIAIAPQKDGSLSMEAIAKTFRYLDEEEVAKQKKAAQEAAKKAAGGKK
ncbi:type 4a pilus biogenesis protein PilO [Azospira sp. APE16]|jgi:type IV pilus assembly protein PilO|uniref:Tfp pilus assembly protein PilO n=2 Tax=Azospira oryzae TaxID=146939 RepID=G8QKY6_AZOOP|nr:MULTISPECIES: type 4a pilus biogenesis protein PilO [Azospira]AEV25591.1 Tfp pilus assembly protein PilO [Azospira oryzae PS]MDK9690831.1 type 4a pilus biogenesis protein PilO [Azospira sp.]RZT76110.1 type IV pilus assembly protein PilO [Azospira oryzae]BBN89831.1 type 4 fimbrial biogenesis protein PilO [Azospira sp. I09]